MISIREFQRLNVTRGLRWHGNTLDNWSVFEWAGAMCGEAGECANAAKKLKRLEQNLQTINEEARHYSTIEEAKSVVAKEAADTIIYGILLIHQCGLDAEDVIREVFNKKSEEYGFPERL
jgi:NTP pyrophosphatase (non-canonical NTP hydrolase)